MLIIWQRMLVYLNVYHMAKDAGLFPFNITSHNCMLRNTATNDGFYHVHLSRRYKFGSFCSNLGLVTSLANGEVVSMSDIYRRDLGSNPGRAVKFHNDYHHIKIPSVNPTCHINVPRVNRTNIFSKMATIFMAIFLKKPPTSDR